MRSNSFLNKFQLIEIEERVIDMQYYEKFEKFLSNFTKRKSKRKKNKS